MPAARQTASSSSWRARPSGADLGEAGREDDERAHALRARTARAVSSTAGGGHGDDRELDVAFDVGDRANRRPAGDLAPLRD